MVEIPVMLLSAGASSRMGTPKQLLPWGECTLLEHRVQTLMKTGCPVMVVLGDQAGQLELLLENYLVLSTINQHWAGGLGTSISCGIRELEIKFPEAKGVLITQLDQPLVSESHLNHMLGYFEPGKNQIIVSRSASGWEGVPVLFDRAYFKELRDLAGEEGARKIFRSNSRHVKFLESREVLEDMDTPEAYERLLSIFKKGT